MRTGRRRQWHLGSELWCRCELCAVFERFPKKTKTSRSRLIGMTAGCSVRVRLAHAEAAELRW